jgi:hypothetical protein
VRPAGRPVLRISAEMDLRAIVGFKPSGSSCPESITHLQNPITEDLHEKPRFQLDFQRRDPEVDVMKPEHGHQYGPLVRRWKAEMKPRSQQQRVGPAIRVRSLWLDRARALAVINR